MAEDSDESQEKTEDPSQRKLDKAREDGQVLTSKDMFVFRILSSTLITIIWFCPVFPLELRWFSFLTYLTLK